MKSHRILIVDDNPTNLSLLCTLLELEGYLVEQAVDAEVARTLIAKSAPDLILMDVGLPGMDGITFTRELKSAPETRHIPIAIITAAAMKGDDAKALAAGCDAYITKPIDTRSLPSRVAAILGVAKPMISRPDPAAGATEPSSPGSSTAARAIVVVDDVASNRLLLRAVLESDGHEVLEAADGLEALDILRRMDADAVISDALMPNMDGFRLCLEIRKDEALRDVAFIIYTSTYDSPTDRALADQVGVDAYLFKPASRELLLSTISDVIQKAGARTATSSRPMLDEFTVIKSYNATLISKLEERNDELSRAVAELREADEFSRQIINGAHQGIAVFDHELRYQLFNPYMESITGKSARDVIGRRVPDVFPAQMTEEDVGRLKRALAGEIVYSGDYFFDRKPLDAGLWLSSRSSPMRDTQGAITGVISVIWDITERKRTERALSESESLFRQVVENINEVFWITDPGKNTVLYVSPAYRTVWGRSCESLISNPRQWVDSIHPEDRARVLEAATSRQALGEYDEIYRILQPDGTRRWIHDQAFPVRDEKGNVYRIVGTAEDITVRKRAERRASVQHEVTEILSEGSSFDATALQILQCICKRMEWDVGLFWRFDRASRSLRCLVRWHRPEEGFAQLVDALVESGAHESLPHATWERKKTLWISADGEGTLFRHRDRAVRLGVRSSLAFPVQIRDEVFGVAEFFSPRSLTPDSELLAMFTGLGAQIGQYIERKRLEDQFRQAQKMEAIGTLAGGIAHDFNNVLGAIMGFTELARMELVGNPEVDKYLEAVLQGCARAADLVRQILSFSRIKEQVRKPMQLGPVVDEALRLLRATIPTTVEFEVSIPQKTPDILGDPTQIHQIVMNLATNAAHAMKDKPGRLGVTVELIDATADLVALHPGLRTMPYIRLGVSDTGHGMDAATLTRIFDPFFTTKAPGEGTGLGLAVVHGIMQSHDGVVTVYSQPGKGTQFHLYFPAYSADLAEPVRIRPEIPRGNGARVLVVDDEKPIALVAQKMLSKLGYVVDLLIKPADALEAVRAEPERYALVITDLTMPGMTGTDLAVELLKICPRLPVVLTTGYSATLTQEKVSALGIRELLLKPLTLADLGLAAHKAIHPGP